MTAANRTRQRPRERGRVAPPPRATDPPADAAPALQVVLEVYRREVTAARLTGAPCMSLSEVIAGIRPTGEFARWELARGVTQGDQLGHISLDERLAAAADLLYGDWAAATQIALLDCGIEERDVCSALRANSLTAGERINALRWWATS